MTSTTRPAPVALGDTGLVVGPIGLGAGPLGDPALGEADVRALLDAAWASGVTLFDTAPSYGESEARLGRLLPREAVVATKLGYGVPDVPDWTGRAITEGARKAARALGRDVVDVALLHSCPREVLARDDIRRAVEDIVRDGVVRAAGYSGDGEALAFAVDGGAFSVVEASYSIVDRANAPTLARARARGMGVMAKRALANAAWRPGSAARGPDRVELARRLLAFALDDEPDDARAATFVRFAAHAPFVDVCLIGTTRAPALRAALAARARGPLDEAARRALDARYAEVGASWPALI